MIDNYGLISTNRRDGERYTSLQRLEIALNQATAQAEISDQLREIS